MKQSKLMSFVESIGGTAIGFVVAFFANMLVLPWFGLVPSVTDNLLITTVYTAISVVRGFGVRRLFEALNIRRPLSPFMQAVIAERYRQVDVEGWDAAHDDDHYEGNLCQAGAAYVMMARSHGVSDRASQAMAKIALSLWPWREPMKPYGFRRDLVKAGALIIAEGEKHDRQRKTKVRAPQPFSTLPRVMPGGQA